jgi:hypothetical protein
VHQISGGFRRRIIGTFQLSVTVKLAADILPVASRRLAVFKHIGLAIPAGNRWRPIWDRLVRQEEDKVRGLGGRPELIPPSPHGYDGPQGHPGHPPQYPPHCPPQHEPGKPCAGDEGRGDLTGRVGRLFYDCFGDFEGFELRTCDRRILLPACSKRIERVALQACRFDLPVTVWLEADSCCDDTGGRDQPQGKEPHDHSRHAHGAVAMIAGPAEHATPRHDEPEVKREFRIVRIAIGCC